MLYAVSATIDFIACVYLLLRRGNAFAPDVTTPARLRRWTATFFACMAVGHVWYMPSVLCTSADVIQLSLLVGGLLDCITIFPLVVVILLCMLQDRRRPLWPVGLMTLPLVAGMVVSIATRNPAILPMLRVYLLVVGIGLLVYMVYAVRQYQRWLRDNYVDLEHKEVWQSFVALALFFLTFGIYVGGFYSLLYEYVCQVLGIVLAVYLLWRVETLSELSITPPLSIPVEEKTDSIMETEDDGVRQSSDDLSADTSNDIELLLQQYCTDTRLYLQHDLTVTQLAQAIGTNRFYLGQYFSRHKMTYNDYINELRINHFIRLYKEALAAKRSVTAQQLASESGYRSYSTFSLAFKQRMGLSVKAWMSHQAVG